MRRKPLLLVLMALVLFSALLAGCRRSVVPPVDTLVPEDEATAAMQEAEDNTEEMQETPEATSVSPAETPTEEPQPTAPAEPVQEPTATTEPAATDPSPTETTAPPVVSPTTTPGQTAIHVVQPGENLFRIALRYNTTVEAVSQANSITNPGMIYVGQELTIPAGSGGTTPPQPGQSCATTYVVKPGDNLFRIALRYNYSQYYLAQVNGISNPALIRVGQTICIP